jgi:hypothetical protein
MIPKEKAIQLVEQFMEHTVEWDKIKEVAYDSEYHAKKCALIAVDEILQITWVDKFLTVQDYWNEVKQEIEKL